MKKSPLILALSAAFLLSACNSDDPSTPSPLNTSTVQAFDGAINGMVAHYDCGDSKGTSKTITNKDGFAVIENETFATAPEKCSVMFKADKKAVDFSNGKDMTNVVYHIPKGFMQAESKYQSGNPFTTLLNEYVNENTDTNINELKTQLLKDIGFEDDALSDEQKSQLFADPQTLLESVKGQPETYSLLLANTVVLSDVLTANRLKTEKSTPQEMAKAALTLTEVTVQQYPNYPMSDEDPTKEIYVDLTETLKTLTPEDVKGLGEIDTENNTDLVNDLKESIKGTEKPKTTPEEIEPTPPSTGTGTGSGNDGGVGA